MAQVGAHYLVKQLLGCAIGMALCLIAAALDYRRLKKFAWPLFGVAVVLLVLVFLLARRDLEPRGRTLAGISQDLRYSSHRSLRSWP